MKISDLQHTFRAWFARAWTAWADPSSWSQLAAGAGDGTARPRRYRARGLDRPTDPKLARLEDERGTAAVRRWYRDGDGNKVAF